MTAVQAILWEGGGETPALTYGVSPIGRDVPIMTPTHRTKIMPGGAPTPAPPRFGPWGRPLPAISPARRAALYTAHEGLRQLALFHAGMALGASMGLLYTVNPWLSVGLSLGYGLLSVGGVVPSLPAAASIGIATTTVISAAVWYQDYSKSTSAKMLRLLADIEGWVWPGIQRGHSFGDLARIIGYSP